MIRTLSPARDLFRAWAKTLHRMNDAHDLRRAPAHQNDNFVPLGAA